MNKLKTQLYIDTSNDIEQDAVYQLVDFFSFETIEITESIKVVQDVASVFSDYTKNFVVPASKNNNKIFSHYYSTTLLNGFDARIKRKARIFINGVFFKEGYVRLSNAKIKDGYPYSYELVFFGALSGLQDVIGEDKLTELTSLEKYKHEFNTSNVFDGLTQGLQYNGTDMEEYTDLSRDIVYPLISARNNWVYDSSGLKNDEDFNESTKTEYIFNSEPDLSVNDDYGITIQNLKPAIKVSHVIDAISEKYASINFKQNCFFYGTEMKDLYLYLHNEKSSITQEVGSFGAKTRYFIFRTNNGSSSFDLDNPTGDSLRLPLLTFKVLIGLNIPYVKKYEVSFNVESTVPSSGDVEYTMTMLDGTNVIGTKTSNNITDSLIVTLESDDTREWNDLIFQVTSEGGLIKFETSVSVSEISGLETSPTTITADYASNEPDFEFDFIINIYKQMPDMKIIDFLTGLFKMFNLVAYVEDSTGEIEVKTLDKFYKDGDDRDVTNYLDTFNYDVDRLQLYGEIDFKFQDESTFGLIKHNEINQDDFGNLSTADTLFGGTDNIIFDEEKYEIQLPFEKIYYDRLPDENRPEGNPKRNTTICRGWLVDKDQEPTLTKPILFYNIPTDVNTSDYKFGIRNFPAFIDKYNRASNSNFDSSYSLNFNAEIDEFTLDLNENSLFKLYYQGYITNTFNKESRKLNIEGILPLSFLFEYSLGDRLLVNGTPFRINEITTNLNTGKSQLELLTSFSIDDNIDPNVPAPSDVTGLTLVSISYDKATILWEENTETDLAGYNVYLDGVFYGTTGLNNTYTIFGLTELTTYQVKVTAYNNADKESLLADATALSITTTAFVDDTPPDAPMNVTLNSIDSNSAEISWDKSRDDVLTDYYRVFVDGVFFSNTSVTNIEVTGLSSSTSYQITVSAVDTSANESLESIPLRIDTIN